MKKETELHRLQAQYENYVNLTTCRNTATRYAAALESFFGKFQDRKSPDEFSRVDIEDYLLYRRRDGVSPKTVNYEVGIVGAFWNWMLRQELVDYNPAATVKRLKELEPERHSLTEAEQWRLYETANATGRIWDRLLVSLVLSTGLRAETMVQLSRAEVDFESSTLRVPAAKMKAGRNHAVPLREDILTMLQELPDGRLFEGYARTAQGLSYRFNHLLKRSGIALRGLRFGRRCLLQPSSARHLRMVQDLLGHTNIATTSRYLVTADQTQTRAAIEKLPRNPGLTPHEEM